MTNFVDMAEDLVATEELDPVYVGLRRAYQNGDMKVDQVMRFLLTFHMFYHIGLAAQLSETPSREYWSRVEMGYDAFPRGTERRHFRGKVGRASIESLRAHGSPEECIFYMMGGKTYDDIRNRVKSINGFGDYFCWKVADMQDRVLGVPVDFSQAHKYLHSVPIKGARMIAEEEGWPEDMPIKDIIDRMAERLSHLKAPPMYDRPLHIAEIETILCAWKGYRSGSYTMGKDIVRKRADLEGWGTTAQAILAHMPQPLDVTKLKCPVNGVLTADAPATSQTTGLGAFFA